MVSSRRRSSPSVTTGLTPERIELPGPEPAISRADGSGRTTAATSAAAMLAASTATTSQPRLPRPGRDAANTSSHEMAATMTQETSSSGTMNAGTTATGTRSRPVSAGRLSATATRSHSSAATALPALKRRITPGSASAGASCAAREPTPSAPRSNRARKVSNVGRPKKVVPATEPIDTVTRAANAAAAVGSARTRRTRGVVSSSPRAAAAAPSTIVEVRAIANHQSLPRNTALYDAKASGIASASAEDTRHGGACRPGRSARVTMHPLVLGEPPRLLDRGARRYGDAQPPRCGQALEGEAGDGCRQPGDRLVVRRAGGDEVGNRVVVEVAEHSEGRAETRARLAAGRHEGHSRRACEGRQGDAREAGERRTGTHRQLRHPRLQEVHTEALGIEVHGERGGHRHAPFKGFAAVGITRVDIRMPAAPRFEQHCHLGGAALLLLAHHELAVPCRGPPVHAPKGVADPVDAGRELVLAARRPV